MESDQRATEQVLSLLRQWGWEAGIERIETQLARAESDSQNRVVQSFLGWMAAERGDFARAEESPKRLTYVRRCLFSEQG